MAGFESNVLLCENVNFNPALPKPHPGLITTDGQLIIGSTALNAGGTHLNIGTITSPGGTITIGYSSPNITLDLAGGSVGIDSIAVQTGISPVVPTAAGLLTFNGSVVASGTNPVRTDGTGANTMALEVQISQAIAATDATKIGLSNFDSARFTVDANGFVSLNGAGVAETITGDDSVVLSPTAGNWNIFGRSGSKTSGAVSTLTIQSPPYSDQGVGTTVTLNSGSFATAAITLTLPASAGLANGDLVEFVCTTAGALVIRAVGTQQMRVGSLISSAAGTLTSTAIGDSVSLRFRAADGFWYATSVIGVWLVA